MTQEHKQNFAIDEGFRAACQRIVVGLVVRYGNNLFSKIHGEIPEFSKSLATVLHRAGFLEEHVKSLHLWLQQGLRPFSDYPPTIEILMHLAYLVKEYPISDYQDRIKSSWYALDTLYSQTYFKSWRGDKPIDEMMRERVWITAFDDMQLSSSEIKEVSEAIQKSGLFRQFPPSLEQFKDAVIAVRKNAPLVEVAWVEAMNGRFGDIHPLVAKARGVIGSHDLNAYARDRDMEQRFKTAYRNLLLGELKLAQPIVSEVENNREYESKEEMAKRISKWS